MLKNTEKSYGYLSKTFHWAMAVLIIGMLALGLYMTDLKFSPEKLELYGLHKSVGSLILFLVIARFAWRQLNKTPALPDDMKKHEKLAAHLGHYALYGFMFVMPLSGLILSSAAGFPVSVFGLFQMPDLVGKSHDLHEIAEEVHEIAANGLMIMIGLHALAALKHHFIDKNDVLKKMLPALAFIAVLFAGNANAAAKWEMVPEGSKIEFKAVQNNAPVTGSFDKFSADIDFDKNDLPSSKVKIIVDMGSVSASYAEVATTLKTPDWFSSEIFPQAVFESSSITSAGDDKYVAEGTLTIRDKVVPVKLEFSFDEYSEKEAVAVGSTTISRTAFGVGQGDWAKTDNVKDEVELTFTLKAKK